MSNRANEEGGPRAFPTSDPILAALAAGAGHNPRAVTWTTGKQHTPSPNRAAIRRVKRVRRRWLRKHGRTRPDLAAIGRLVAACGHRRLRDRCGHPACPRCALALQRLLVRVLRRYLAARPEEAWMTVSIILPVLDPDGDIDLRAERERYAALLDAVGITQGVFGLDVSWNEDHRHELTAAERFAAHACVHLYGLAPTTQVSSAKAGLKRLLPPSNAVPRPVKTPPWDGRLTALAYVHKSTFQRRQTILKFNERRGRLVRTTRDRPLTVAQQIQAIRALERAGPTGRLLLRGVELRPVEPAPKLELHNKRQR